MLRVPLFFVRPSFCNWFMTCCFFFWQTQSIESRQLIKFKYFPLVQKIVIIKNFCVNFFTRKENLKHTQFKKIKSITTRWLRRDKKKEKHTRTHGYDTLSWYIFTRIVNISILRDKKKLDSKNTLVIVICAHTIYLHIHTYVHIHMIFSRACICSANQKIAYHSNALLRLNSCRLMRECKCEAINQTPKCLWNLYYVILAYIRRTMMITI